MLQLVAQSVHRLRDHNLSQDADTHAAATSAEHTLDFDGGNRTFISSHPQDADLHVRIVTAQGTLDDEDLNPFEP